MKGRRRSRRYNGCRDKARYGSFDEAKTEQPSQQPYSCDRCLCWHITSQPVSQL